MRANCVQSHLAQLMRRVKACSLWICKKARGESARNHMTTHEEQTNAFAQELLDFAIALVAAFPAPHDEIVRAIRALWASLYSAASITNFEGCSSSREDQQPVRIPRFGADDF